MKLISIFNRIDPIVFELIKAGLGTYFNHIKAYSLVAIAFILTFLGFSGSFDSMNSIYAFTGMFRDLPQTAILAIIALLSIIISYYVAFRNTLMTGELGMEFNMQYDRRGQLFHSIVYNVIVLSYFLLWDILMKSTLILLPGISNENRSFITRFGAFALTFGFSAVLLLILFLFVAKYTYTIFMLEEDKVPLKAMDPLLILMGFAFGLFITIMDFFSIVLQVEIFTEFVLMLTYLTPGIILMPIFAYAMAHLKVASTIIGYENIFTSDRESQPSPYT